MRADTTASGAAETIAKRYLNIALHDVHIQQNWPWAERTATLITRPPNTTGTVYIASESRTTVVGHGTRWGRALSGFAVTVATSGGKVYLSNGEVYLVSSVDADEQITLSSRYTGDWDTASDYAIAYGGYKYFQDEYALASGVPPLPGSGLLHSVSVCDPKPGRVLCRCSADRDERRRG